VLSSGCAASNAVKGGIDSANTTVSGTKGSVDSSKQIGTDLKSEADKALGKGDGKSGGSGEKKEDDDGKRLQAKVTKPNQPVNDEINMPNGDLMDWKSYDLGKIPARAWVTFELNWDEGGVELNLDIYDQTGKQVVQSPGRSGVPQKTVLLRVDTPGVYYARIYALGKADATVYTVTLLTKKGGALAPPVAVLGKDKKDEGGGGAEQGADHRIHALEHHPDEVDDRQRLSGCAHACPPHQGDGGVDRRSAIAAGRRRRRLRGGHRDRLGRRQRAPGGLPE